MNSLTGEGSAKLNIDNDMYTVGTDARMSADCLQKILIRESHPDSNATSSMIRFKLSNLDDFFRISITTSTSSISTSRC